MEALLYKVPFCVRLVLFACEDYWGKVKFIPRLRVFFFVWGGGEGGLNGDQLVRTIPLFPAKDPSTAAQRAERTMDKHSLTSCV